MNLIEPTTLEGQPIFIPMHSYDPPGAATARDTAVMRVRDFTTLMKIVAAHDLWDELEAHMLAQGCTNFRIGAQPMRIASEMLWRKIQRGELPMDTPGLFSACSSLGGRSDDGDAAATAGDQGGASGAAGAAESAKKSEPITPGESEGSKDKPQ